MIAHHLNGLIFHLLSQILFGACYFEYSIWGLASYNVSTTMTCHMCHPVKKHYLTSVTLMKRLCCKG